MKRVAFIVMILPVLCTVARADEASDSAAAKAIVERAVKAAGWDKDPVDLKMTWKDKGAMNVMGAKFEYTADWAYQGPDKYRFVMSAAIMGQKFELTVVANGKSAWESAMGMMRDITGEKLEYTVGEVYQFYVTSLVPLLKDAEFKLKPVADKDVDGQPAAGIEVTREGKTAIRL
jgi:hypothetical protein